MESAVKDFNVDDALHKYIYELEHCTTDIPLALPTLQQLAPVAQLEYTTADAELYDALFPSTTQTTSAAPVYRPEDAGRNAQEAVKEDNATTVTKRTEAWAAKNRRAQKRFRERQKAQREQMEQQLTETSEKLKQLEVHNSKITQRNSTLEKVLVFREGEIAELQDQNKILDEKPDNSAPPSITAANQADRVVQAYRSIVNLMADLLLKLDQQGNSEALLQEMRGATRRSGELSMHTAVLSPENMIMLMRVNMDPCHSQLDSMLEDTSSNGPEHWRPVADLLDLEPDQKRDMLNLHARFLHKLEDNRSRRRDICSALQQGSEKVKKLRAEVATEAQKYVASMAEVHSEVGQLRDNLREQHRIWLDFYSTVFHVWDPVQHCRVVVHSFPRYPDILQICTCLAKDQSSGTQLK